MTSMAIVFQCDRGHTRVLAVVKEIRGTPFNTERQIESQFRQANVKGREMLANDKA